MKEWNIMRQKVLLVCNYFAPDHTIAAVRTSKIAKYLKENGYEIEVLTEKKMGEEDTLLKNDVKGIRIHYAENSSKYIRFFQFYEDMIKPYKKRRFDNLENRKRRNPKTGNIEFYPFETAYPIIGSMDYIVGQIKQIDLFENIKGQLLQGKKFDYIITSYGDSFCYFVGKYFHKHHKKIIWIFDIRDSIYRYKFTPDYVSWIPKRYEKYIWKNADGITGVSKGICKRVPGRFRKKVYCLTNGFDKTDRKNLKTDRIGSSKMIFSYTGSMYGGLCDLSVFFEAMGDLIRKKEIDSQNIEFHFAGNESAFQIFKSQAEISGLGDHCVTHGRLSRQDALELQQQSDILLIASYDFQHNEGGVITGKALEYMAAGRSVVAVIMGDIEHSELADIIRKTNVGFAYEDYNGSTDYEKLCEYLKKQYQRFTESGKIEYSPNGEEIMKYDYQYLCKRLIRIMNQVKRGKKR